MQTCNHITKRTQKIINETRKHPSDAFSDTGEKRFSLRLQVVSSNSKRLYFSNDYALKTVELLAMILKKNGFRANILENINDESAIPVNH